MVDGLEWLICDEPCKAMDARSGCHCAKARDEITRFRSALTADDQTLRLHLGEMTAQEMRTLRAGFSWVLARAALSVARAAIRNEALEEAIDLLNALGDHASANFYASAIEALMEK